MQKPNEEDSMPVAKEGILWAEWPLHRARGPNINNISLPK